MRLYGFCFILAFACCACEKTAKESFEHGWSGWSDSRIGCTITGPKVQLRGRLQTSTQQSGKGKHFGGTFFVLPKGEKLIVAYGATAQHRKLAGKQMVASGHYCTKRGQAYSGKHFHIETLRPSVEK